MNEFSFIDNAGWLKPFIIELHNYYNCSRENTLSEEKIATQFDDSDSSTNHENEDSNLTSDNAIFINTSLSELLSSIFSVQNLINLLTTGRC